MIYRFKKPIFLSNGKILGNDDPTKGPLGGECFFDADEDNEIQRKVKEQIAKEAEENAAKEAKKKK
jgi:hypothetical protein